MNYFWVIKVYDDGAAEDAEPVLSRKGSGNLQNLSSAIASIAIDLEEEQVMDVSVDPLPVGVEAE